MKGSDRGPVALPHVRHAARHPPRRRRLGARRPVERTAARAWRDPPTPPDWLLVHVPGWDTATVGHCPERLAGIPVVHFGDIDPNGVRIRLHLRQRAPGLRRLLPDFWFELADTAGLPATSPPDLDLSFAPATVRQLASRGLWLEQERIVLDPRMVEAILVAGNSGDLQP